MPIDVIVTLALLLAGLWAVLLGAAANHMRPTERAVVVLIGLTLIVVVVGALLPGLIVAERR